MKIGLINYYLRTNDYPTRYSLSILRLAEYLNSLGYDVDILPISLANPNIEKCINDIISNNYNIIGISHYIWSSKLTPFLSKTIKQKIPNIDIIIGGPETQYINLDEYDDEIFVLGEGEESLVKIIEYIKLGKVDNNFFKENENIFNKKNPDSKIVESDIKYLNPLFTKFKDIDKDFLYYETSRGCYYKCGYCGFRNREHIANFDLEFVKKEIINIGKLKFKEVFVIDANLGGTPDRAKKILKYFNEYAKESMLTIYLRPEFIDDEMISILKKCNIKEIRIGIQTTNENVPKWIRSNSLYHVTEELPKLSKNNIPWKAELIIGLPGDNFNGLKNSIDFVEKTLKPSEFCCYPLTLIKGTPMYDLVNNKNEKLWIQIDKNSRAYASSTYTNEELIYMQNYSIKRMNKYLNNVNINEKEKQLKKQRNTVMHKDIQ